MEKNVQENTALRGRLALRAFLSHYSKAVAFLFLLALVLAIYGPVLLASDQRVISLNGTDIASIFLYSRQFGFGELRHGNLALWNPYILCGYPFFGNFQSNLLYPLNWHYLFMPIDKAINFDFIVHIFLGGWLTFCWARWRRISFLGSLLAACLLMFCDPFSYHAVAGHLTPIAVMSWGPLIFWSCDGMMRKPELKWSLLGSLGFAMQMLAGHPQYAYYIAIAALIYSGAQLWRSPLSGPLKIRAVLGIGALFVMSAVISAVQIMTGLEAAAESARSGGLPYRLAQIFSFPPESLLTLLTPSIFGDSQNFPYWGYGFRWEMSFFCGVGGLLLAVVGFCRAETRLRLAACVTFGICVLLALGSNTPLFPLLYKYAPGFNALRGISKFIFPATLVLVFMAGLGFDELRRNKRLSMKFSIGAFGLAIVLFALALAIRVASRQDTPGWWAGFVAHVYASRELYAMELRGFYDKPEFLLAAGNFSALMLCIAGGGVLVYAALLFTSRRFPLAIYALCGLVILEIFSWSRLSSQTFDLKDLNDPVKAAFFESYQGDERTFFQHFQNRAMVARVPDLGGYDPYALRRYSEFIYWTQGYNPDKASADLYLQKYHPAFRMLRCGFISDERGENTIIARTEGALPHVLLLNQYEVENNRNAIFRRMGRKDFDPSKTVILEQQPLPRPAPTARGHARVTQFSTDDLTIEADCDAPSILLVTDGYSRSWTARPLAGSSQGQYAVLPANYMLRAIPLEAGRHRIQMVYAPRGFYWGRWISLLGLVIYLATAASWWVRRKKWHNKES